MDDDHDDDHDDDSDDDDDDDDRAIKGRVRLWFILHRVTFSPLLVFFGGWNIPTIVCRYNSRLT